MLIPPWHVFTGSVADRSSPGGGESVVACNLGGGGGEHCCGIEFFVWIGLHAFPQGFFLPSIVFINRGICCPKNEGQG